MVVEILHQYHANLKKCTIYITNDIRETKLKQVKYHLANGKMRCSTEHSWKRVKKCKGQSSLNHIVFEKNAKGKDRSRTSL